MKVIDAWPIKAYGVTTDEPEFNEYTRYGKDCWYVMMGESNEPVYECRELEEAYQNHIKQTLGEQDEL